MPILSEASVTFSSDEYKNLREHQSLIKLKATKPNFRKTEVFSMVKSIQYARISRDGNRFFITDISINLLKLPSSQGIVGEKSFVASR